MLNHLYYLFIYVRNVDEQEEIPISNISLMKIFFLDLTLVKPFCFRS